MTITEEQIRKALDAAWDSLDPLEFDLLLNSYESLEQGRELSKGEMAAMEKFARLCGLPCAQTLIEAMTEDIEP